MNYQGSHIGHPDQTDTAFEIIETLGDFNRRNREAVGMKAEVLFFGHIALQQYSRLWFSPLVGDDLVDAIKTQLRLSVDSNDQLLDAGVYVDPDCHRSSHLPRAKHEATSYLVSAMEIIGKSFPSLPRQISLLIPGDPFDDPHCLSIKSRFGPHAGEWLQIPHPSLFLANTLKLIKMYSERLQQHRIPNFEKRQAHTRINAQARLLRIFVDILDRTGLSDSKTSDAISPVRLYKHRICQDPRAVVDQYLTRTVAQEAARWEAGIEGRQNDSQYLQDLYSRYMHAFDRVSTWVSEEVREWELQPPSCFKQYEDTTHYLVRSLRA